MTHFYDGMANVEGFQTLYIKAINDKLYIWHDNTTIGPGFNSNKELVEWANNNLRLRYV